MKKVLFLILSIAMLLSLYGCGGGESGSAPPSTPAETEAAGKDEAEVKVEEPAESSTEVIECHPLIKNDITRRT